MLNVHNSQKTGKIRDNTHRSDVHAVYIQPNVHQLWYRSIKQKCTFTSNVHPMHISRVYPRCTYSQMYTNSGFDRSNKNAHLPKMYVQCAAYMHIMREPWCIVVNYNTSHKNRIHPSTSTTNRRLSFSSLA